MPSFGSIGSAPISGLLASEIPEGTYFPATTRLLYSTHAAQVAGIYPITVRQVSRQAVYSPNVPLRVLQSNRLTVTAPLLSLRVTQASRLLVRTTAVIDNSLLVSQASRLTVLQPPTELKLYQVARMAITSLPTYVQVSQAVRLALTTLSILSIAQMVRLVVVPADEVEDDGVLCILW